MRETSEQQGVLFADHRQARGWLVARVSSAAIGAVTWAYLAAMVLGAGDGALVLPGVFALLALGLLAALLWGRRVSGGTYPAPASGAGRRGRLRQQRRLTEEAARQVGWSPALVVWASRVLVAIGVGLMVVTAVAWLSQRG